MRECQKDAWLAVVARKSGGRCQLAADRLDLILVDRHVRDVSHARRAQSSLKFAQDALAGATTQVGDHLFDCHLVGARPGNGRETAYQIVWPITGATDDHREGRAPLATLPD